MGDVVKPALEPIDRAIVRELTEDGRGYVAEHRAEVDGVFAQQSGPHGPDPEFMQSLARLFDAVRELSAGLVEIHLGELAEAAKLKTCAEVPVSES